MNVVSKSLDHDPLWPSKLHHPYRSKAYLPPSIFTGLESHIFVYQGMAPPSWSASNECCCSALVDSSGHWLNFCKWCSGLDSKLWIYQKEELQEQYYPDWMCYKMRQMFKEWYNVYYKDVIYHIKSMDCRWIKDHCTGLVSSLDKQSKSYRRLGTCGCNLQQPQ